MRLFRSLFSFKKGDFVKEIRVINQHELDQFSRLTGDHNPLHQNIDNGRPMIHGAFLNGIVAGIIGTKLPGHQSMVVSQSFSFPAKCYVNDPITFYVELEDVRKIIKVKYRCTQNDSIVFEGNAKLMMNKLSNLQ